MAGKHGRIHGVRVVCVRDDIYLLSRLKGNVGSFEDKDAVWNTLKLLRCPEPRDPRSSRKDQCLGRLVAILVLYDDETAEAALRVDVLTRALEEIGRDALVDGKMVERYLKLARLPPKPPPSR